MKIIGVIHVKKKRNQQIIFSSIMVIWAGLWSLLFALLRLLGIYLILFKVLPAIRL